VTLATSPLDQLHRRAGAKMVPFGGWTMPLSYPSGTLAEHRACRSGAALFDVSHLGTVRVAGPEAAATVQATLTNDLRRIAPGRTQYSQLLDAGDASVLDDVVVWWVGEDHFDVMANAANTGVVAGALDGDDITAERALLAVQGPEARACLAAVWPEAAEVARHRVARLDLPPSVIEAGRADRSATVAGTGYTGEDGVEIAVPAPHAAELWGALVSAGTVPAGLGARDTLRLEAGLALFGHELGPGISPLQAGIGWSVGWDKGDFPGRAALAAERERGPKRRLRGLVLDGRRPPRAGQAVHGRNGQVGHVTSGNFSPVLRRGIALALVAAGVEVGDDVEVAAASGAEPAHVVSLPFVPTAA